MKISELRKLVREVLSEMEDELDEISVTGNVDGYKTPHAFKKSDGTDEDDEPDSSFVKRINTGTGYTQVNESIKQGKRYGSWSVTQYDPIKYDDLGSVSGGLIKLVNQKTADTLLIQHDNALRGAKWWISTQGKRVQDQKPEVVIQKAIKLNEGTVYTQVSEDVSWKRFLDPYNWFKGKDIFQNRFKNVEPHIVEKLTKLTKKNGDTVERVGKNSWGITKKSSQQNQAVWQYLDGVLYYTNPNFKSKYDSIIPKLVNSKTEVNEATNRYQKLRKDEGTPNQKIGVGIRELRKQLSEIEKFVTWYGRIKNESGLDSADYWKRTQRHLSKISERLNKLSSKVRDLSV
jgi:hypothetical protein